MSGGPPSVATPGPALPAPATKGGLDMTIVIAGLLILIVLVLVLVTALAVRGGRPSNKAGGPDA